MVIVVSEADQLNLFIVFHRLPERRLCTFVGTCMAPRPSDKFFLVGGQISLIWSPRGMGPRTALLSHHRHLMILDLPCQIITLLREQEMIIMLGSRRQKNTSPVSSANTSKWIIALSHPCDDPAWFFPPSPYTQTSSVSKKTSRLVPGHGEGGVNPTWLAAFLYLKPISADKTPRP